MMPTASAESRLSDCTTLSAATTAEAPQMPPPTASSVASLSPSPSRRPTHQPIQSAANVLVTTTTSAGPPIFTISPSESRKPSPATAQRSTGRCATRTPGAAQSGTRMIVRNAMPTRITSSSAERCSVSLNSGWSASRNATEASIALTTRPGKACCGRVTRCS